MATTETAGQRMASEVSALLRARNALLWIVTPEEARAERSLIEAAASATYDVRVWDCINGVTDMAGKEVSPGLSAQDPARALAFIQASRQRSVWILRDLQPWLKDPTVCRAVRNLARTLPSSPRIEARALIVLSPSADVPAELADHAIVVKWALPDRAEIGAIFDNVLEGLPPEVSQAIAKENIREAAIEAAVGLSANAAAGAYSNSLVTQNKRIVPSIIAAEKRRVISGKGIEWFDPDPRGLDAVGGLDNVKPWLVQRKMALTERARAFGLPAPKGIFLVGVPGCGKSLIAKATATAFDVPLLKLDLGGMQSKWVGESQQNIRAGLSIVDTIGRCVLWVDEIEKALAGATSGAADGGVSSDALGTFLTWMQERKSNVFVIATANDVSKLPPELLRKGRFDELFFVDLPTRREREEIVRVTLKQYGRDPDSIAIDRVADVCDGFTGAEIAALLPDALFAAFAAGERALNTADLTTAAKATVPLSKTASDKITALREWAKGRARPASLPEESEGIKNNRNLDL